MDWKKNIYGKRDHLKNELERLKKADISEKNKEHIRKYQSYLLANNSGEERVVKLSCQTRKIGEWLKKDFDEAIKEDIEEVVKTINIHPTLSNDTKIDYRRAIKQFYKWLKGNGETMPPEVKWIKKNGGTIEKRYLGQTLIPEEIDSLIQACDTIRDKALIAFLYETGARIGEILSMSIGDFIPSQIAAKARLNGKTGERIIPIVTSVPYLAQYLTAHPLRNDKSAPLWICTANFNRNKPLKYVAVEGLLKNLKKITGIKKRMNPHMFRHARATELAKHLTEVQLDNYFGWRIGSAQTRTYVHASGRDLDFAIMKLHGMESKEQEKEEQIQKPIMCARCKTINGSADRFCSRCGGALTIKVALESETQIKEETNKTVELLMEIMKNPELLKRFEEFKMEQEKTKA